MQGGLVSIPGQGTRLHMLQLRPGAVRQLAKLSRLVKKKKKRNILADKAVMQGPNTVLTQCTYALYI